MPGSPMTTRTWPPAGPARRARAAWPARHPGQRCAPAAGREFTGTRHVPVLSASPLHRRRLQAKQRDRGRSMRATANCSLTADTGYASASHGDDRPAVTTCEQRTTRIAMAYVVPDARIRPLSGSTTKIAAGRDLIEELLARMRAAARATSARRLLLSALVEHSGHCSAEEWLPMCRPAQATFTCPPSTATSASLSDSRSFDRTHLGHGPRDLLLVSVALGARSCSLLTRTAYARSRRLGSGGDNPLQASAQSARCDRATMKATVSSRRGSMRCPARRTRSGASPQGHEERGSNVCSGV